MILPRPSMRLIVALQGLTALGAVVVLIVVLVIGANERKTARRDSCYLLRALVLHAVAPARHTAAVAWLNSPANPLHNCHHYGEVGGA